MANKRVLIVNKFLYPRGGDCIVASNTTTLLRSHGYEVGEFAMKYDANLPSPFSKYYAPEVSFAGSAIDKLRAAARIMGGAGVKDSFAAIVEEFKPDVVWFHNIHSYLSPAIVKMAKERGCRVLWTLHDYKLACPSYLCLRDGKPCGDCLRSMTSVVKHRCMKGSLSASLLGYVEAKRWPVKKISRWVDYFICPSKFLASMMREAGVEKGKLKVVCNFIDPQKYELISKSELPERRDYAVYIGRLSHEKGIDTLLEAAKGLHQIPLRIYGSGPIEQELKEKYSSLPNVKFMGKVDSENVVKALSGARFSVVPSEWYENNPLSLIESLCCGVPVVGANIGGIPELISNPNCGELFTPGNIESLRIGMSKLWKRDNGFEELKYDSLNRFSAETHFRQIAPLL